MTEQPATNRNDAYDIITEVIRERKTAKILGDPADCGDLPDATQESMRAALYDMVEVAGWAPFHKVADEATHRQGTLSSPVPWRFYILEKPACCRLIDFIGGHAEAPDADQDWKKAQKSKIPRLLAAASALVQVTWLPDPPEVGDTPAMTNRNIEHIAAASAATQNLLLAATARGLHNYWSSGGILNNHVIFDYLGIPRTQMLLGSIFLVHPDQPATENQPGGLREKRGEATDWSIWVSLSD